MVCFHQSEWGVEFSHLKSEIDTFLDKGINKEEDEGIKNILIERKNEALQITEAKVNALSFWKEVKVSGNSMPEGVTYEPHTNSCRKMHSWETEPILQPGESPSTLEQFPTNNKVYHFHPNMFVRQMKRMGEYLCIINRTFFFESYKKEYSELLTETKLDLEIIFKGIEKYETCKSKPFSLKQIAYILATIKHETSNYKPVIESFWSSKANREKYYEEMYDPILGKNETRKQMAINNGNTTQGDGVKYAGKGYVQITWKKNYQKAKEKFGVDFVTDPDLAIVPSHAINIALYGLDSGMFTGKSIHDYIINDKCDYYNARRVINGTDAATTIKGYAEKFEKCLKIE